MIGEYMREFSDRLGRLGVQCVSGVSGATLTTFRSGGAVDLLVLPRDESELASTLAAARECGVPRRVIGGGSNLLLPDAGYAGALIRLSRMDGIERKGRSLTVRAGVKSPVLAAYAAGCGLSGAEFACGIPGTVGGMVMMNAGAFGQSVSDLLLAVTLLTSSGQVERLDPQDPDLGYRRASFPAGSVVLSAELRLVESDETTVRAEMRAMREKRSRTQPHAPSAGSVFRRVGETPAALYVERTGLKGRRIGGAELSPVHCNLIVNAGGATTEEYFALAERVRERVRALTGVTLEYEVERIC